MLNTFALALLLKMAGNHILTELIYFFTFLFIHLLHFFWEWIVLCVCVLHRMDHTSVSLLG